MATSALNSTIKRPTSLAKSSESGDDSSYSTRRSASRRHRSLSRFSHRMPDPEIEVTPMRKGKFVNTVRGSGFGEISLDDLAVEFFQSFSCESEVSSGERGRPVSRKFCGGGGQAEVATSQRRGRSVSRVCPGSNGGLRRLDADTESSRRRRSLSRQPSTRGTTSNHGNSVRVDPQPNNSSRRRSVSRQPRDRVNGEKIESAVVADRENANSRRRRSLSVVNLRNDNSESDAEQVQYSSNSRDMKSSIAGKSQSSRSQKPTASDHKQGQRTSFSQKPVKYHDGYSSYSSAVTDDEGKDSSSSKHGSERIIRTVYAQNKATPKKRESLGNSDYGSQRKSRDDHHDIPTSTKVYATKLQESKERKRDLLSEIMLEEERSRELSMNLKNLLTENSSEAEEKTSHMRKESKDRSNKMSMCLTDEAEQFIDEIISNIEDTDFSSLEDEKSESSSCFGLTKTQNAPIATIKNKKSVPVEMDGVTLPWLQWETPDDTSSSLSCLNNSPPHTPSPKSFVWDSDPTQDSSSGKGPSIGTLSSRGSWGPCDSATKPVNPKRRLKIDVAEYLQRPNSSEILNETWKLRHRINSGTLVLCSRSLI